MAETFRPGDLTVIFGSGPITGFMDGEFLSAEKNSDAFNLKVGATGKGARNQTHDESGTVTFTLLATSADNATLTAIHEADKAGGDGVFPFLCKDLSGLDVIGAERMWIRKAPVVKYSGEVQGREWVLETDNLELAPGGNPL